MDTNNKKRIIIKKSVAVILCTMFISKSAYAGDNNFGFNNKLLNINEEVHIENNIVFVPLREVFEAMDYDVSWNGENKCVTVKNGDTNMIFGTHDGKNINSSYEMINSKTYILINDLNVCMDYEFIWDSEKSQLKIEIPQKIDISKIGEDGIAIDSSVIYDFATKDLSFIANYITKYIDSDFDLNGFEVSENSLVNMHGKTVFGVVSLKHKINDFVSNYGYDFYVTNGSATKLTVKGNPLSSQKYPSQGLKVYSDEELKAMANKEISLGKNEYIVEQRILKRYDEGKYYYAVVTEINNSTSNISRSEYFKVEL